MEENTVPKKQHPLTTLAFLEVGLFEVFFVATVLLLIFGTLNYFNILSVSEVFPQYLGWLPRQDSQAKIVANKIVPPPTPTPFLTAVYTDNVLKPYISSIISSDAKYSISDIFKAQSPTDNINTDVILNLDTNKGAMSGILQLSKDKSDISLINFSFSKTFSVSSLVTLDAIQKEASNFFSVISKGQWKCKTFENVYSNTKFCENFWEETNGTKRGLYYQDPVSVDNRTNEKKTNFSFCEYRKDSDRSLWKSCISAFSKTGI